MKRIRATYEIDIPVRATPEKTIQELLDKVEVEAAVITGWYFELISYQEVEVKKNAD